MKGEAKVIEQLNFLLADELAAINQYMVHAELNENWGFEKLGTAIQKRSIQEMKHAESLISRIIFLDGKPIVSKLHAIHIGQTVADMLKNDLTAEAGAVKAYNDAIVVCVSANDSGTRELLEDILEDEEEHLDELEAQLDQIEQMGLGNYLTTIK